MDTGEVPGYEFEAPRGPRHRTRQDSLRPFPQDPLRPFRPCAAARAAPPPRASVRTAGGGVLAVMRTRNWLVGLVLPIVVAVIVGIAVVVTAGGGGNGGAAPSALAAGFPPARLAGTAFTGPAGTTPVMLTAIAASAGTEVLAGTADGGPALWVSADGGSAWTRAALTGAGSGQLAGVAHGAAGWLAVGASLAGTGPAGTGSAGTGGPLIASSPDGQAWTVRAGRVGRRRGARHRDRGCRHGGGGRGGRGLRDRRPPGRAGRCGHGGRLVRAGPRRLARRRDRE